VSCARTETIDNVRFNLQAFLVANPVTYYWTFTFHACEPDRASALRRFKPFRDLVARRGGQIHPFWELQQRGSWHVHCLINVYLDVNWLRPWMMNPRHGGWGQQMYVDRVFSFGRGEDRVWYYTHPVKRQPTNLVNYLVKYLVKDLWEQKLAKASGQAVRLYRAASPSRGARRTSRRSRVDGWMWTRAERPGMFFHQEGAAWWKTNMGRRPRFADMRSVMHAGYVVSEHRKLYPEFDPVRFFNIRLTAPDIPDPPDLQEVLPF
jgi:hypothetical protein